MNTGGIFSLVVLILVTSTAFDASSRALAAEEKPNPEKVRPPPSAVSSQDLKDSHPNTQSQPVDSSLDSSETGKNVISAPLSPEIREDDKDGDAKENTSPQKVEKDKGEQGDRVPLKGDDNVKKDDGKGESESPLRSPKDSKDVEGQKESHGSSRSQDKGEQGNVKKEKDDVQKSFGPSKSEENGNQGDPKKKGSDPLKDQENAKKESDGSLKSQDQMKKDNGEQPSKGPSGGKSQIDKHSFEMCDGKCQAENLVACLRRASYGSKEFVMLVRNAGEDILHVNIAVAASAKNFEKLNLAKGNIKMVNISAEATRNLRIVLNAGKGDCIIQIGINPSISDWNPFQRLSPTQSTSIYGAAFLFFTVVIAGGVWGCCKFRRGRRTSANGGIAYQQLEMAEAQMLNSTAVDASSADGWDEGWDDDDWDEEVANRPSSTSVNGNISSNGLSSRSPNRKNDWDIDWDE